MSRLINADALMIELMDSDLDHLQRDDWKEVIQIVADAPTINIEPLTDKEQRIFLAAMERERKICKEVDDQYVHEPYEVLLTKVCREIERKVKKILWN